MIIKPSNKLFPININNGNNMNNNNSNNNNNNNIQLIDYLPVIEQVDRNYKSLYNGIVEILPHIRPIPQAIKLIVGRGVHSQNNTTVVDGAVIEVVKVRKRQYSAGTGIILVKI
eukprot:UN10723